MMAKNIQQNAESTTDVTIKYSVYFVIFGAMIFRGAFFTTWLIILNLLFLTFIILRKSPLALDLNTVFLFGLFLVALLSALLGAGNKGVAFEELIKYSLFPLSYIAFVNINDKAMVERAFYHAIILLAAVGILAIAGFSIMPNMIIEESGRLQSFLQYANTTAMLLSVGILFAINYFFTSKNKIHLFYGLIILIALFFTRSRIGIFVFLTSIVMYIIVHLPTKIRYVCIAALTVLIAVTLLLGYKAVMALILGPTLVERLITYIDAFPMCMRNIFGVGMGMWQYKQLPIQTAHYYVKYIHSVYFQIALDCGILGLLCFMTVLGRSFVKGVVDKNVYVIILFLIAAGSMLEVNFAFGIVIMVFTFILSNIKTRQKLFQVSKAIRISILIPVLILLCYLLSDTAIFVGKLERDNPAQALSAYRMAQFINPWNNKILLEMAKVEPGLQKSLTYLEQGHSTNPLDRDFIAELATGYNYANDFTNALKYADLLFELNIYSKETQRMYEVTVQRAYEAGAISKDEHDNRLLSYHERLDKAHTSINPLYRYINPRLEYNR